MKKSGLTEADIRTKYITTALQKARWDLHKQIREEKHLIDGPIHVQNTIQNELKRFNKKLSIILKLTNSKQNYGWECN